MANAGFALLYLAQPGAIANARPGSFADAFFFSVQTIATLGYGVMAGDALREPHRHGRDRRRTDDPRAGDGLVLPASRGDGAHPVQPRRGGRAP